MTKLLSALLLPLTLLASCATNGHSGHGGGADIHKFSTYMAGAYSSSEQAAKDPAFPAMVLMVLPIWESRTDGPWVYAELAPQNAQPGAPRDRHVYRLRRTSGNTFRMEMHGMPQSLASARDLERLTPSDLQRLSGCDINLTYHHCADMFEGTRKGAPGSCDVALDAPTVSRTLMLWSDLIILQDRGYDQLGKQIVGPESDGLRLKKVAAAP